MVLRRPGFKAFVLTWWDEVLAALILLVLALFLLGHDLFGLNGYVASFLAVVGGVVVAVIGFVLATMILPLVAVVTTFVGSLFAVVLAPVLTFVMGSIILPVVAFITGAVSGLLAWLAGTWLGTLLMPVINLVSPLVLKFGPWLAAAKNSEWAWRKVNQLRTALGYRKMTQEGRLKKVAKPAKAKSAKSKKERAAR